MQHFNWRRVDWNNVVFGDESRYSLMRADARPRGTEDRDNVMSIPVFNKWMGSVWGASSFGEEFRKDVKRACL